jgi:hypothetical protein
MTTRGTHSVTPVNPAFSAPGTLNLLSASSSPVRKSRLAYIGADELLHYAQTSEVLRQFAVPINIVLGRHRHFPHAAAGNQK